MRAALLVTLTLFALAMFGMVEGRGGRGKGKQGKPGYGKPGHGKPGHGKPFGKPGHGKPGHGKPKPTPTPSPITTPSPNTTAPIKECSCEEDLNAIRAELECLKNPEVFSCELTEDYKDEVNPIPYTSCYVSSPNMDISTGKFTVAKEGIYRITFTARFSAMQGDSIRADMFVDDLKIGRAATTLKNNPDDDPTDLETTSTLTLLYDLKAGQEVYMMLKIQPCSSCSMGMSTLQSKTDHPQIFFTGEWIKASSLKE